MDEKKIANDEISLKELVIFLFSYIIKLFKNYKLLFLILYFFILLISFYLDYDSYRLRINENIYIKVPNELKDNIPDDMIKFYKISSDKKNKDPEKDSILIKSEGSDFYLNYRYKYIISFRPDFDVNYGYFNNFYNYLMNDIFSKYLLNNFSILNLSLYSPEINEKTKLFKPEDFPVNSLNLSIFTIDLLNDKTKNRFKNYILSYIFMTKIDSLIETVKQPLMTPNNSMILTQDYEQTQIRSEILLLVIKIQKGIQSIFDLRNNDIGVNYKLVYDYLININEDNKFEYFNMTKDMLLEFLHREFFNVSSMTISFNFKDIINPKYKEKFKIDFKKYTLIILVTLLVSIIIISIYDFFKKNWKEIVKEK